MIELEELLITLGAYEKKLIEMRDSL